MYYYQHNIGDFDKKTRHLTRIERSVYLDMIHLYYTSEQQLPLDVAALCRKVLARDEVEKAAVLAVLDEFFDQTPDGWYHDRCEEELAGYRKLVSQASIAGKASAAAKLERKQQALNGNPTTVQRPFNDRSTEVQQTINSASTERQQRLNQPVTSNQEPITINHKPEQKQKDKRLSAAPPVDLFPGVDPQVVKDFTALRTKKKAPVTATAMAEISKQAELAGLGLDGVLRVCCARGWSGFKAEWVEPDKPRNMQNRPLSRQAGFDQLDYSEGIEDGRIT